MIQALPKHHPSTIQAPPKRHPSATQALPKHYPSTTQALPKHYPSTTQAPPKHHPSNMVRKRRKALSSKSKRKLPSVSEEESEAILVQLKAIKKEFAARVQELSATALEALREIAAIEEAMQIKATDIHADYVADFPEFKLTFQAFATGSEGDDCDEDELASLEQSTEVLEGIEKDSTESL